jgi:hypothetical protein
VSERTEAFMVRMRRERETEASNASRDELAEAVAARREIEGELAAVRTSRKVLLGRRVGGVSLAERTLGQRLNQAQVDEERARGRLAQALDAESAR